MAQLPEATAPRVVILIAEDQAWAVIMAPEDMVLKVAMALRAVLIMAATVPARKAVLTQEATVAEDMVPAQGPVPE